MIRIQHAKALKLVIVAFLSVAVDGIPMGEDAIAVRVSGTPETFQLFDPVEIRVEVTNRTAETVLFLCPTLVDLSAQICSGPAKETRLPREVAGMTGLRRFQKLPPRGCYQANYPLYELLDIKGTGVVEISYSLTRGSVTDTNCEELAAEPPATSGKLRFTVQSRTEAEVERLVLDMAAVCRHAKGKERKDALRRLLAISHPSAVNPLIEAWSGSSSEERTGIVDALLRIGTPTALKALNEIHRQGNIGSSDGELYLVQRVGVWCAFHQGEAGMQCCFEIWNRGKESKDKDVREVSAGRLLQFRTNAVPLQVP
jgi:hypothetical protein